MADVSTESFATSHSLLDVRHRRIHSSRRAVGRPRYRGADDRHAGTSRARTGMDISAMGPVALGHRRLSIIDVVGGAQPMSNEDGTIWVSYNGELYNELELRRELEAKGHVTGHPRTRRAWSISTRNRASISCGGSMGCSRWRSGIARAADWSWHATGWVRSPYSTGCCRAADSPSDRSPRRSWLIPEIGQRTRFQQSGPLPVLRVRARARIPSGSRYASFLGPTLWCGRRDRSDSTLLGVSDRHRPSSRTSSRPPRPSGPSSETRWPGIGDRMCRLASSCRAVSTRRVSPPHCARSSRRGMCERSRSASRIRALTRAARLESWLNISGPTTTNGPFRSRPRTSSCLRSPCGSTSRSATPRSYRPIS